MSFRSGRISGVVVVLFVALLTGSDFAVWKWCESRKGETPEPVVEVTEPTQPATPTPQSLAVAHAVEQRLRNADWTADAARSVARLNAAWLESGGWRTPIELFVTGVGEWEAAMTQLVWSLA